MGELQVAAESFPLLKLILWCFYPIITVVIIELLVRDFDDDDDQGGGMMVPALQGLES